MHSISKNKTVFDVDNIDIAKIETYYSKYFTVKKKNGTSALYSDDGEMLVNFGSWDYIYPSSVSSNIVVAVGGKYGIVDYNGNVMLPVQYEKIQGYVSQKNKEYSVLSNNGKYAFLKQNGKSINVDLLTLNSYIGSHLRLGCKYHYCSNTILDNNLNVIYSDKNSHFLGTDTDISGNLKNGVMLHMYLKEPVTYNFLLLGDNGVKVEIDKKELAFDVLPIIQNGRTLVPMRAIFEALGADVEWNEETQSITAKGNDITVQMQIGNNILTKNGQNIQMDVSPQIIDGRTMVPVRAVSDSFNVTVDWDGYTQTVSLFTN